MPLFCPKTKKLAKLILQALVICASPKYYQLLILVIS